MKTFFFIISVGVTFLLICALAALTSWGVSEQMSLPANMGEIVGILLFLLVIFLLIAHKLCPDDED